jgi:hypothetical protein
LIPFSAAAIVHTWAIDDFSNFGLLLQIIDGVSQIIWLFMAVSVAFRLLTIANISKCYLLLHSSNDISQIR